MSTAPTLIDTLQQPSAYPHAVERPIRVLQTHISWVLLTGRLAYKIKKPVNFGFVDFSTLQQRHYCCQEEVRLGGRLAPHLYLGVVPITGCPDDAIIGGDGPVLEYAVVMRQFPQEAEFSQMIGRGELRREHLLALARVLADFHAGVPRAAPEGPYGTLEEIRAAVLETLQQIEQNDGTADARTAATLRAWVEAELDRCREAFLQRRRAGCIRECHGDLHTNNILLLDGRPLPFDCIDFNNQLRWIDTASEIAFLAMDLLDRKCPTLAWAFLNAYLEISGDYGALRVLRYYLVYRALVRAKVAGLRLAEGNLAADEATRLRDQRREYLQLAESFTRPRRARLLVTHGLSGSGKTTLSAELAEALAAVRVRSDLERKRLFRPETPPEELYSPEATARTYRRLADIAQDTLRSGWSVLVDAACLKRDQRAAFRRLAEACGVPLLVLSFQAPDEVLRQRITQRQAQGTDASDATVEVLQQQQADQEPITAEEALDVVAIDTTDPAALQHLLNRLTANTD